MDPRAQRLELPEGYGKPAKTLKWAAVRARLEESRQYWLATSRPDGRPHVVPIDGVWLDDAWFFGGSPQTVHHRNLEQNPQAIVHLPDGAGRGRRGEATWVTPPAELAQRLAEGAAKYGYGTDAASYASGLWVLHPKRVLAWTAFPRDATRFLFT
ncbi:MAG: pyridoxamine 5'-phosphate oxidase family protein [Acidimicrobiales bacterium]